MIIDIYTSIIFCFAFASTDQLQAFKLWDRIYYCLTLHTCLAADVIIAVPAVLELYGKALTDEQVNHELSRNKLSEYATIYKKEAVICWQLLYFIYVCTFISICFHRAFNRHYKTFCCKGINYLWDCLYSFYTAFLSYRSLLNLNGNSFKRWIVIWQTAKVGIYAQFFCR